MESLLVVAGEASGDRAAAGVVSQLLGVRPFGVGGAALAAAGTELLTDLRSLTAMGAAEVMPHAARIARAAASVLAATRARAPRAALLVGWTEFNARLAACLHGRGTRVVWYGAPQIWAWRPGRAAALRPHVDRMAVMLPFEEALWREAGVDAHYVGHPSREVTVLERTVARRALGLTPFAPAVALLPGSRPHEVRRLLGPMLAAYAPVRDDRASVDARVLLAPSLDPSTRAWARDMADRADVKHFDVEGSGSAASVLGAFDVALCASGTVSLEAAIAGAVPVVVYRVSKVTELVARALVRTPYVALPNVLLGRRAFPELLQRDVNPRRISEELTRALRGRARMLGECAAAVAALGDARAPSRDVARMLAPLAGARVRPS